MVMAPGGHSVADEMDFPSMSWLIMKPVPRAHQYANHSDEHRAVPHFVEIGAHVIDRSNQLGLDQPHVIPIW